MKNILAILVATLLIVSCKNNSATDGQAGTVDPMAEKFAHIVEGMPVIKLPLLLEKPPGELEPIVHLRTLAWADEFRKTHYRHILGRVFPDQPSIHLLASHADNKGTKFLLTFDADGNLLKEEALQRGHFITGDPEYASKNYSTLHPDRRLVAVDSLFKFPYDPTTNSPIEGEKTCKVTQHEYVVNADGRLKMTRYETTDFFNTGG